MDIIFLFTFYVLHMKKLRNKFKKLSIWWKIWGAFLFLSALAITIFLISVLWELINEEIDRYRDEDIIPFLIWGLLIISWISYFFREKKWVKWIFYISLILAFILLAWLIKELIYDYNHPKSDLLYHSPRIRRG